MAILILGVQFWGIQKALPEWQTMVFMVLCLTQLGHVLAVRSENESLFRQGLFSNKPLLGAVILSFALQLAITYVPFLNPIFKTQPLSMNQLLLCMGISSLVFFAVEAEKWLKTTLAAVNGRLIK